MVPRVDNADADNGAATTGGRMENPLLEWIQSASIRGNA